LGLDRNPKDEYLYQMMIQPHRSAQEDIKEECEMKESWNKHSLMGIAIPMTHEGMPIP
jgi:hypothetical protein